MPPRAIQLPVRSSAASERSATPFAGALPNRDLPFTGRHKLFLVHPGKSLNELIAGKAFLSLVPSVGVS